ncbi:MULTISPECIES: DUF6893 family small protein [Thermomonospora]|uniref:Uncharacterized protein n=1 Tax=Thermomonospora cellulosilytica TaxID=1411118 RepID=A0A7W3MTI6_9ACTN|nr:hypothetical protein [Thermomonospora cellulosilytica]
MRLSKKTLALVLVAGIAVLFWRELPAMKRYAKISRM